MVGRRIWLDEPRTPTARYIDIEPGRHFTWVTLDRDEYVYRASRSGGDAALPAAFTRAARACTDSATDHLYVHGYAGGFVFSTGPSRVTIPVPFALADRAAQALRTAEIGGDVSELEALAADLTVPLDEWLAPGERELRRGVDFTAAPSAFLAFLRGKAATRGLRLNGRAVDGAVWVRPSPAARPDGPRLRGETDDPAVARPYVGARAPRPPVPATPVTFLESTDRDRDRCPCGYSRAHAAGETWHARAHLNWSTGIPIPKTVRWYGDDIAVVTATSPAAWRKLAHQCSRLPQRENGYDFASFDIGDGLPADNGLRAYLYRARDRVVGYASVFDDTQARWFDAWAERAGPHPDDGLRRPVVNVIFTAQTWRRSGVAREMVLAVAAHSGVDVSALAWAQPLSRGGQALARSLCPVGVWLC